MTGPKAIKLFTIRGRKGKKKGEKMKEEREMSEEGEKKRKKECSVKEFSSE